MSYTVTENDILSIPAQGAVLALEMTGRVALGPVGDRMARAGGETLKSALRAAKFVSVGRAAAMEGCGLPFERLILTATPRFLTGKANELMMLRLCYESVFALAEELGIESLALPFLSAMYYHFPQEEVGQGGIRGGDAGAAGPEPKTLSPAPDPLLHRLVPGPRAV